MGQITLILEVKQRFTTIKEKQHILNGLSTAPQQDKQQKKDKASEKADKTPEEADKTTEEADKTPEEAEKVRQETVETPEDENGV